MKRTLLISALALAALSGCADETKDYDASARCQGIGLNPGTQEYDRCVREEKASKLMEQQRRDYEAMKQQQMDWKLRGY